MFSTRLYTSCPVYNSSAKTRHNDDLTDNIMCVCVCVNCPTDVLKSHMNRI